MRIALFVTCVNDLMYPDTGKSVVHILERLGHEVDFPLAQTCCGQMHANSGYRDEALPLVRHFAETFAGYEAIVVPSGSCAAMVRDAYPRLVPETADVAARTYELSELLVDVLGGREFQQLVHDDRQARRLLAYQGKLLPVGLVDADGERFEAQRQRGERVA